MQIFYFNTGFVTNSSSANYWVEPGEEKPSGQHEHHEHEKQNSVLIQIPKNNSTQTPINTLKNILTSKPLYVIYLLIPIFAGFFYVKTKKSDKTKSTKKK